MTARSVTLARASTQMRRLFRFFFSSSFADVALRLFFSSSVADVALKARSLHEHKQERHLYKDISSPLRRQID